MGAAGRFPEFFELTDFLDVPLRSNSSDMPVWPGLSVVTHIVPDVVLMDEVFVVGDAKFQVKCMKHVMKFKSQSKTLLVVTHNPGELWGMCERAIRLDRG